EVPVRRPSLVSGRWYTARRRTPHHAESPPPARKARTNQRGPPQHGADAPADRRLFEPGSADHGYPNRQSSWQWARSRPADTPQPTPLTAKRVGSPSRPAPTRARQPRPRLAKPPQLQAVGSKPAGRHTATDTT